MKNYWKISLLIVLLVGAILLTVQIVKAQSTPAADPSTNDGAPDLANKLLGSAATTAFAAGSKIYADASALNVRATPSITGTVVKAVGSGALIGTATGTESTADSLTWIELTLSDGSKAYVAKNYIYSIAA